MIAMNIKTGHTIQFTNDVTPQYAVAYGVSEDLGALDLLFEAQQEGETALTQHLSWMGVVTGTHVVSCKDWRAEVQQYDKPIEHDAFYTSLCRSDDGEHKVLLIGTLKQVQSRLILESKGNDSLIFSDPELVLGCVLTDLSGFHAVIICTDIEVVK